MSFELLQPRSVDDPVDVLYANPGSGPNSFVPEPADGPSPSTYASEGVVVSTMPPGGKMVETGRIEKVTALIAVTDSRFVFACTKFKTGGGWRGYGTGGILVAAATNAISGAIAARSTRGYSLVGHVRWEWLVSVNGINRKYGRSSNQVNLLLRDPAQDGGAFRLAVFPPNRQRGEDIARDIARRAATWRAGRATGEERTALEVFATTLPSSPTSSGNGLVWKLPD